MMEEVRFEFFTPLGFHTGDKAVYFVRGEGL